MDIEVAKTNLSTNTCKGKAGRPHKPLPCDPAEFGNINSSPQARIDQRMVTDGSSISTSTLSPIRTSYGEGSTILTNYTIWMKIILTPGVVSATLSSILAKYGSSASTPANAQDIVPMKIKEKRTAKTTRVLESRDINPFIAGIGRDGLGFGC